MAPYEQGGAVTTLSTEAANFGWLFDNFVRTVPGARHTLVVSADGLLMAMSEELDRTCGDQLAAIVSGLSSLTRVPLASYAGEVRQAIIEMDELFLFLMSIATGRCSPSWRTHLRRRPGRLRDDPAGVATETTMTPQLVTEMREPAVDGACVRAGETHGRPPPGTDQDTDGRAVRPYAVTGGRIRAASEDLPMEALVECSPAATAGSPSGEATILQHAHATLRPWPSSRRTCDFRWVWSGCSWPTCPTIPEDPFTGAVRVTRNPALLSVLESVLDGIAAL